MLENLLLPPLRFASRDGGSRAANLRDLGRLVEAAARKAREKGAGQTDLDGLVSAARAFDEAPIEQKGSALRGVVRALAALVSLPDELASFIGTVEGAVPAAPAARTPPSPITKERGTKVARSSGTEAKKPEAPGGPARIALPAHASALAEAPLTSLGGLGPRLAATLAKKGVSSVAHLLYHLPRAYQDRRDVKAIRDLVPGEKGMTFGEVLGHQEVYVRRSRKKIFRVVMGDATGKLALTFFHAWPGMARRFEAGKRYFVWGEVKLFGGTKQIVHPELEEADDAESDGSLSMGRIVPVYRGMEDFGQGRIRGLVAQALARHLQEIPEILPEALRRERDLPEIRDTIRRLHFPQVVDDPDALSQGASPWHRRLAYEELFLLSVGLALKARGVRVEPGFAFDTSAPRLQEALSRLPFAPTAAQRRVIEEIAADMAAPEPMNRLLQGDVGSGKTAVALVACLLAVANGKQAAVLAPTEILAEQHHRSFSRLLEGSGIEVALLVAGRGARTAAEARERIASGGARIAIGTHALMSSASAFESLGLVVIDEQHRFGVEQRAELIGKGRRPDVLVMTATPIPRTLALVLHGELTQSVIDELPPGRTPILTKVLPARDREKAYRLLEKELRAGRQGYVVYPLIEESEHADLEDATRGLATLQERFPGSRLALLHGRMKPEERDRVMEAFRAKEVDLLVSTTVVEVGVDVPNATVMVVENAERFGLSQLHQLRGRVGRGDAKSACLLIDHGSGEGKAGERLRTMERTNDGFAIAQADLEIRGPGEFLGTRQAGLPELAWADLARDARLLEQARSDAFTLVARDPDLSADEHRLLLREVMERFAERMSLARVG